MLRPPAPVFRHGVSQLVSRINHEQASALQRAKTDNREVKAPRPRRTRPVSKKQDARQKFVDKHAVGCFKCRATTAEWAKTGIGDRGAWAICFSCVAQP